MPSIRTTAIGRLAFLGLALTIAASAASAQDFTQDPASIFAGCQDDTRAPRQSASPRERVRDREAKVDKYTQRRFASFSMDEIERGAASEVGALCWARLDGVWQENGRIRLDRSKDEPGVWGADRPELVALTNGNYTTLRHLVIVEGDDPSTLLYLSTGLTGAPFVAFRSTDDIPLEEVFRRGGKRKTYEAAGPFEYGRQLSIDVTRSGRVRLRLDRLDFYRPEPAVTEGAAAEQLRSDDAFLVQFTMENLRATRQGYNIVTHDPFFLQRPSTRSDIFAEPDPTMYSIDERRIVPVGFKLIVDDAAQGMVFRKKVMASGYDIQQTVSHSLGGSLSGAGFLGAVPVQGSVSLNYTQSAMEQMERTESIAQAIGYSRTKKHTIVVDHPYVELSDDFIDAIEDARRYGNYQRIIDRFGTHYAYAVTYGATAMVTQSFTESEYKSRARSEWGIESAIEGSVGVDLLGASGSVRGSMSEMNETGNSGSVGSQGAEFVGVGGNGSWNEGSWMAGETPYPILLDLRPIDELLNPMNFPGEPEVYDFVRRNLRAAIARHLAAEARARPVSTASMLPNQIAPPPPPKAPEPDELYYVYVRTISCSGALFRAKSVKANNVNIFTFTGPYNKSTTFESLQEQSRIVGSTTKSYAAGGGKSEMGVACEMGTKNKKLGYGAHSPGLLQVRGTRAELTALNLGVSVDFQYDPGWTVRTDELFNPFRLGDLSGMRIDETRDYKWTVSAVTLPDFNLWVRVKRKK